MKIKHFLILNFLGMVISLIFMAYIASLCISSKQFATKQSKDRHTHEMARVIHIYTATQAGFKPLSENTWRKLQDSVLDQEGINLEEN